MAVAGPQPDAPPPPATTASSAPAPDASPPASVWDRLAERLNPAYARPRACGGLVARQFTTTRGRPYYIVKNPAAGTYVRLTPDEYFLLGLMDGQRQVKDLVLAYLQRYHRFAFQRILDVVDQLREHRFLAEEPRDVWSSLAARLAQRHWTYRANRLVRGFLFHQLPLQGLDAPMGALYRRIGWLFFTRPAVALLVVVAAAGGAAFVWEVLRGRHDPLRFGGSYAAGLFVLLALWAITVTIHELGHAMATKHYGREVRRGGVMLYYGFPAFFVDTTDVWLEPRRARLVVELAGVASIWGLGGLASLYALLQPDSPLAPLAYQVAFIAFVSNTLQLMPLLELDGYYVLVDWLEIPLLRARAFAFVRRELWRKLRAHEPLDRQERIFAIYGSLALVYSGLAVLWAIYFWLHRLQYLLADALRAESPLLRALILVLLLALGVPFLFGLGVTAYQGLGTVRGGWQRLRHRGVEARARAVRDARELLARLRFLRPLSFDQREAIVRQLRQERYRAGTQVLRQGQPTPAFYLIRQGQAEVVQVDAEGWPHELALLRRGDYFGGWALLGASPAPASIWALTSLVLFVLDRAAFDATVAPYLRAYGLTWQWIEQRNELARVDLFRQLPGAELDALLERLQVEEHPAGAIVVRQGEPASRFYIVRRGRLQVTARDAQGQERVLVELAAGDYFGEVALLAAASWAVTVRALTPVALWSLDRAGFEELLLGQYALRGALGATAAERKALQQRLTAEPAAAESART